MTMVTFGVHGVIHVELRPGSGSEEKTNGIDYTLGACLNQTDLCQLLLPLCGYDLQYPRVADPVSLLCQCYGTFSRGNFRLVSLECLGVMLECVQSVGNPAEGTQHDQLIARKGGLIGILRGATLSAQRTTVEYRRADTADDAPSSRRATAQEPRLS